MVATGAVLLGVLPAMAHAYEIAPGSFATFPTAACTLNFVFDGAGDDAGRVFIGTAAHCASGPVPGDEVRMGTDIVSTGDVIGHVVAMGDYETGEGNPVIDEDWALVEIVPRFERDVDPAVRGHSGFPTRVTATSEMRPGDVLQLSGHGTGFQLTPETRERRQGEWLGGEDVNYDAFAPLVNWGDSGGPIVDVKTGGALGIVSSRATWPCETGCTLEGPTITQLIRGAAARGLTVQLRAAGQKAPAAPVSSEPPVPEPPAAAPAPTAEAPRLTLRGCVRRGRLTLRVESNVPLRQIRVRGRRYTKTVIRLRARRVTVTAITRDGARLTARRRFASC